jgi:hypothetical protein
VILSLEPTRCVAARALCPDIGRRTLRIYEATMTNHLSIEIFGLLHGAADGPLAITALAAIALIAIVATPLWWRR